MADRNDELLLALGWKHDKGTYADIGWTAPDGEGIPSFLLPRPYDNLQDAVDCVPEGYGWELHFRPNEKEGRKCLVRIEIPRGQQVKFVGNLPGFLADTPAEALSEAIIKAVS